MDICTECGEWTHRGRSQTDNQGSPSQGSHIANDDLLIVISNEACYLTGKATNHYQNLRSSVTCRTEEPSGGECMYIGAAS